MQAAVSTGASEDPAETRRWSAGRIILLILGVITTLIALALLAGGVALLWVHEAKRDSQGYFTTSAEPFSTDSFALATDSLDVTNDGPRRVFESGHLARIRIRATSDRRIFLGIARASDVKSFLSGTSYTRVTDVDYHPFHAHYRPVNGKFVPGRPTGTSIWVTSATGAGTRSLTWDVRSGRWSVVLMNADGSRGVAADVSVGARIAWLIWVAVGLLVVGVLVLFGGGLMIFFGARAPRGGGAAAAAPVPRALAAAQTYPVAVEGELDADVSRWLWVVKWLLAIPHWIVLAFLWLAFLALTVVAFFAILFTGRYPRSIFDFNVGVLRWTWRVGFYATHAIATDRYPPFTLDAVEYPATLDVPYPTLLSRGLVLVKWWLLAIPHYIVLAFLTGGWSFGIWRWRHFHAYAPGLLQILVLIAGLSLVFRGRYPRDIFELVLRINRWLFRVVAYAALMRDEYPPFRLGR